MKTLSNGVSSNESKVCLECPVLSIWAQPRLSAPQPVCLFADTSITIKRNFRL